ncbi:quinone-dependent dihydroorotate dehydrogenase [Bifidobacterium sp.]|jgi:dihydroorotate dehydrogenase (fumarate)|uniref:quinone-dependent dihydroorotate dehydrogenase n=1 Tax=Bifidobacterium sp. TaxID=41200 RepID=UPI0025BA9A0A|nr:quinone-dependent dihydroorotate dehydrogenase [Bifidobacterium sp.]MCI1636282.1 quinone-dependent dihydroorotate dehydrogenase [Bifidobacterium sp.]
MQYVSESTARDAVNKASTDLFSFVYKHAVKPVVFNQAPDIAHDQMISFCRAAGNIPPLMWLLRQMLDYTDPSLESEVMGLHFSNPFGLSAGLDKNCDLSTVLDAAGFGFETVGSTTSRPCAGNPRPWFHRLPEYDSMMVHVGLANDGSEQVIPKVEKAYTKAASMAMSISIARTNDDQCGDIDEGIEDYRISLERAAGRSSMVEINISCPNTHVGEPFNENPDNLDRLFTSLDSVERSQPLLVKMPLNKSWSEFKDLLDVLATHNVQGISIANLQKDRTGLSVPVQWAGGLSGGPCYEGSNALIANTYREFASRFAIAGIGGVFTPEQAYEKIRCGSSLVMFVSSLMFRGPQQISVFKRGLVQLLRRDGFENVSQAVGSGL